MRRALGALCLVACAGGGSPTASPAPDRQPAPAALTEPALAGAAFARVRAQLAGGDAPAIPAAPASMAYLCAYAGDDAGARCAAGSGTDLGGAIDAATAALLARHRVALAAAIGYRLKLDLVNGSLTGAVGDRVAVEDIGLVGFATADGGFVLPSELLERDLVSPRQGRLRLPDVARVLAERGGAEVTSRTTVTWFRTVSWIEDAGGAPLRLYRVHGHDPVEPDADTLLARAVWATDHLARITGADGEVRYHYDVAANHTGDDYNLLRHGGSIYALLQGYERTGYAPWRAAAERAIAYLLGKTGTGVRRGPHGGGAARFVISPRSTGDTLKLGGSGLALLALDQYYQATGDARYLPRARELARFLVSAQKADGEFHSYLPVEPGGDAPDRVSLYYPGEAILALVRLYEWDPDPAWLAAAVRGADWLIDVRDRGLPPEKLASDHWLMIALSHLYRHTTDRRYLDHSIALAKSVLPNYRRGLAMAGDYPDYRGGFYAPPRSTPAATRAEGLIAVLDTCGQAGVPCGWVRDVLVDTVRHALQAQYTPDLVYWVPDRAAAAGGFMGGITDTSIRNDFVQHALSALLGLERHLRAEQGVVLPGGPRWNGSAAHQAWAAMPAAEVANLRRFAGVALSDPP